MSDEKFIQVSGPLFEAVQIAQIFPDGKTFVDSIPRSPPDEILKAFETQKKSGDFDLKRFVEEHFDLPTQEEEQVPQASTMEDYIKKMWPILLKEMRAPSPYIPKQIQELGICQSRRPRFSSLEAVPYRGDRGDAEGVKDGDAGVGKNQFLNLFGYSSLISLPKPHIVPGGRFRECFYWDSYFTALGLEDMTLVKNMVENFAFLIEQFGFIPNGNRVYFASRSQPPYFSFLLTLLYDAGEKEFALKYIPHLEKEYAYWIETCKGDLGLNRYFDPLNIPRPEAYLRETTLAKEGIPPEFFQHLRAACASGWDFSSRWIGDQKSFQTICTLDILPIDLNCLLYHLEETLARFAKDPAPYAAAAAKRKKAIQTLFWKEDFFFDYNFKKKEPSPTLSLAGVTPLFVKAATPEQAEACVKRLYIDFLKDGGFVTTLTESGHQWDMPNGWAPLQWITIQGLLNYGYTDLAMEGARRWLALSEKIFKETGTLLEKYNVRDCSLDIARGEYALQQGFGWTNGVNCALLKRLPRLEKR
ncbi:trehalase family glycosidase [Candidatus Neptunochlamydia vexilliferae]|nr:trehalase family glycosidase [Candidatus Neptunochlamydia vexilliferae]